MDTLKAPAVVCSDRRLAELAINPETGEVDFIVYDPMTGQTHRCTQVADGAQVYEPPQGASHICITGFGSKSGAVLLPTQPLDYGDDAQLLTTVRNYVNAYVELPESGLVLAVHYAVFSWVHDRFDEVPYLRFFSPHKGVGKSRALEVVGSICYRPIVVGGSSSVAALRRMVDTYRGTLIGDEQDCKGDSDMTGTYIKMLNQGFQRGRPIILCAPSSEDGYTPQKFEIFGPKAVVTRGKFSDDALESRFFTVNMLPRTRQDVPLNLPREEFDRRALELRNMLLQYRFRRYDAMHLDTALYVPGIADRLNQIGAPLLSATGDASARAEISSTLRRLGDELAREARETIPGFIVEYLSRNWWRGSREVRIEQKIVRIQPPTVRIQEITNYLNGNGQTGQPSISREITGSTLTERKVGEIVRGVLGLETKRAATGFYVVRDMNKLDELKVTYGVNPPGSSQPSSSTLNST